MVASRRLAKIIEFVTDIIVGLLGLRIILKLLGASTVAPFVVWVYDTTKTLLSPFQGIFPTTDLAPRLTVEFSSIFAIIIYSFIAYLLIDFVRMIDYKAGDRVLVKKSK
jgi:hypothetical protein